MRRKLNVHDWWLATVGVLFLTLTVPVLSRWVEMTGGRKLIVTALFFSGLAAMWMLIRRPRMLTDAATSRIDLCDVIMALIGCFFAVEALRNFLRWTQGGMTPHQAAIISVLGFLAIFSFYCIAQRGGLKKFATICFIFAVPSFVAGMWRLIAGSASPRYFYVTVSKGEAYAYLAFGAAFLLLAVLSDAVQRHDDRA